MNTIEEPISNNSSPRLSFSQCLIQPDNPLSPQRPVNSPNSDFNFNAIIEVSSSADELFSNGKIRSIPLKKSSSDPNPDPNPVPVYEKSGGKKSLWKFGRSASLNCAGSGMIKIKFLRSYSTGSWSGSNANPNPNPNPKPQSGAQRDMKLKHAKNSKKNYYFEGNGSNLPLFPKERGLIGFLMCHCVGGGRNNRGMEYYCSP